MTATTQRLQTTIDHVVIAVPDLGDAIAEFSALGFTCTPTARHERFGTANALCVFDDDYVELITVVDRCPPDATSLRVLLPVLADGGGVPLIALATRDTLATVADLRAAGIGSHSPVHWSRFAQTPDGTRTAEFTTLMLCDPLLPGIGAFFCEQHTPAVVRHPAYRRHANGMTRLAGIDFPSFDTAHSAAGALIATFGAERVSIRADGLRLDLGAHFVRWSGAAGVRIHFETRGARAPRTPAEVSLRCAAGTALVFAERP